MSVKPIPEGYHSITPYLIVKGASRAIEFYTKSFGAQEVMRFPGPNNTVAMRKYALAIRSSCWRTKDRSRCIVVPRHMAERR